MIEPVHVWKVEMSHRLFTSVTRNRLEELAKPSRNFEIRVAKHILQIELLGPSQHHNEDFLVHLMAYKCKVWQPTHGTSTCTSLWECFRLLIVASNKLPGILPCAAWVTELIVVLVLTQATSITLEQEVHVRDILPELPRQAEKSLEPLVVWANIRDAVHHYREFAESGNLWVVPVIEVVGILHVLFNRLNQISKDNIFNATEAIGSFVHICDGCRDIAVVEYIGCPPVLVLPTVAETFVISAFGPDMTPSTPEVSILE